MNYEKIKRCTDLIQDMFMMEDDDTEEVLDSVIDSVLRKYGPKLELEQEEIDRVRNYSKYSCLSKQNDGQMIKKEYDHYDWYSELCSNPDRDTLFWDRYREYLKTKSNIGINGINKLDFSTLKDLMNEIGDPRSDSDFFRRGLIIGDVQSGKTSTYIGLLCKAADAGYKVIILLTGMTENLRVQTQERVEEGFIGFRYAPEEKRESARVGVGLDGKPLLVTAMTSREDDFIGNKNKIMTSLENSKVVLCVVKKNTKVFAKLIDWLSNTNIDESIGKIPYPMLLIDDEADNASVNTNDPEQKPTAINNCIRELLSLFNHKTYVGFTATPYANIFIDPEIPDEIFPEDFIYTLEAPDKYIGAEKIFYKEGKYHSSLKYIKDATFNFDKNHPNAFYARHKKDWKGEFPESLTDSIYVYFLANAIRDLKGDKKEPRGMIINISRFKDVHKYIKEYVEEVFNTLYRKIKFDMPAHEDSLEKIPELNRLYKLWKDNYSSLNWTWDDIRGQLLDSCESIQIMVVNSTKESDKLDYEKNPDLRVIAIGGLTLSRGITIKGLMVSYFFRNTATYDVLMQMGRWFGYRFNYDELFRIWIAEKSVKWYAEIAESTNILKRDISKMRDLKKTPRDFQLRVRSDCEELRITAPGKMRTAQDLIEYVSFYGSFLETHYLLSDYEKNRHNWNLVKNLVNKEKESGNYINKDTDRGNCWILSNIDNVKVCGFLNDFNVSPANNKLNLHEISKFISESEAQELKTWDIVFVEGEKQNPTIEGLEVDIHSVKRTCYYDNGDDPDRIIVGERGKITSENIGRFGLNLSRDKEIISAAEAQYDIEYRAKKQKDFDGKQYPASIYYKYIDKRTPIIYIYYLNIKYDEESARPEAIEMFSKHPVGWIGLAIGIPRCGGIKEEHKYKVTRVIDEYDFNEGIEE